MENQASVTETRKNPIKRIARKALIFFYDAIICLAVDILLLIIYEGEEKLDIGDAAIIGAIAEMCLLITRLAWRVYGQVWRYGGIQSYIRLLISDGCAFVLFYIAERTLPITRISFARALCIICLSLLGSLAIRMVYRYVYKCGNTNSLFGKILTALARVFAGKGITLGKESRKNKIRIAIVGAGRVGVGLAEDLLDNSLSSYVPKCFIDTDQAKIGRQIQGIHVVEENENIGSELERHGIQEVVIATPQLTSEEKKELYEKYRSFGCKVKVYDYPVMQQTGDGKRHLREFDIEELLFRREISVTDEETNAYYRDKVIMITGGGGSIGSELCRQVAKMSPKRLIILDVYENGAYDVQQELRLIYEKSLDVRVEILSVCNRDALERIFRFYRPEIVIHAAAHKHVPLMEHNCCEAIENNVFGTLNVVELSEKYRAERFMMVSTDKAVNPTNVMGATKRMCEMIVQCHSKTSDFTKFSATRFGNVLGSAGSVIPLFKKQIAAGGPVTLTDKRIIRYFMTIPEASQLVLQSGRMAKNGELFVLDMGKPVKILDLAENMIRLSGYEPYVDIDIKEIGLRPGEKLYEELLVKTEELDKTDNSLIFVERDEPIGEAELEEKLEILKSAVQLGSDDAAREELHKAVPTFRRPEEVNAKAEKSEEMQIVLS